MAQTFDFIIVGGGSAGCVLANRLSADGTTRVLLLEAGGRDRHPLYAMPAGFAKMTFGLGSWGWHTVPQRHMKNRVLRFTQARVIGGGSTVNAQIYTRGNALDYDEWRQLGCEGWAYEDVLPYFKKSEDNDTYEDRYHAKGGPLGVSKPSAPLPICEAYFEAAGALGIPTNHDMTGEAQDGVGYYQLTQRNARRSSTATAFLHPAEARPNLDVRTGANVHALVVEKGRVSGVTVRSHDRLDTLYAEADVILSAGAIGTPRILMLSGIGPADHLAHVGVPVVFDQPEVGGNLQEHLDLFTISECTGDHTYDKYAKPHWSVLAGLQYLFTRKGPVASSLFETGGFWYAEEGARSPDIQFHLGLGSGIEAGVAKMANAGVTLNSAYLRPRSRGTVRLPSSDPAAAPLIDPNYWEDPHDRDMAILGLKLAQEILRQDALKPFVKREVLPGPAVKTDAQYFEFACEHAKTDHHPAGTCRMGSDDAAVVDPRLAFRGLEGLRIVDASIMPRLVSSNTNAPTIMVAEKAADMIRADHGI
ncbi:MAG: GMC family oxidoreductase N-terminal domain-containing protein [Pseudomonadota bacterium]